MKDRIDRPGLGNRGIKGEFMEELAAMNVIGSGPYMFSGSPYILTDMNDRWCIVRKSLWKMGIHPGL